MPAPAPLSENTGLAFRGEPAWPGAGITEREARGLLQAANRCGRPNSDVLCRRLAVVNGEPVASWQVDFPAHFTVEEAALYEKPFARLASGWRNPHADPALRRALARVSRYLAMPGEAAASDWRWIEDELIPDASLVVVARDDDFTHGILQSSAFARWHDAHRTAADPAALVASFPFPWPPATPLGGLSAAQEEQRHAIARAIRTGNGTALNEAVARAYGWPDQEESAARLLALHRRRAK